MVDWIDRDYYRNSANEAPVKAANLAWESIHVWPRVTTVNKFYVKIYPFFVNVFSKSVLFPLRSYKWLQTISLAPNWLLFDQFFSIILQLLKRVVGRRATPRVLLVFSRAWSVRIRRLTNRQQFSMVCTLIDHRNDVKMFKTQVQPRAEGELFLCKVMTFWAIS